jgi:hypothetical protein
MVMRQMVLPLIVGAEATKRGLLAFVQQMGMLALRELFDGEAEMIAGPKGKHVPARTHHHWGTTRTPLPFGGRRVVVERPRVRRTGGGEEMLPSVGAFRDADPLLDSRRGADRAGRLDARLRSESGAGGRRHRGARRQQERRESS